MLSTFSERPARLNALSGWRELCFCHPAVGAAANFCKTAHVLPCKLQMLWSSDIVNFKTFVLSASLHLSRVFALCQSDPVVLNCCLCFVITVSAVSESGVYCLPGFPLI